MEVVLGHPSPFPCCNCQTKWLIANPMAESIPCMVDPHKQGVNKDLI